MDWWVVGLVNLELREKFGVYTIMLLGLYFKSLLGTFTECLYFKLYVNLFKTLLSTLFMVPTVYLYGSSGVFGSIMLLIVYWLWIVRI